MFVMLSYDDVIEDIFINLLNMDNGKNKEWLGLSNIIRKGC